MEKRLVLQKAYAATRRTDHRLASVIQVVAATVDSFNCGDIQKMYLVTHAASSVLVFNLPEMGAHKLLAMTLQVTLVSNFSSGSNGGFYLAVVYVIEASLVALIITKATRTPIRLV